MIKNIEVIEYRRLKDLKFEFEKGINIISGTNGTCKSSLLYLISNSFQSLTKNSKVTKDKDCLEILKTINKLNNPKIESLTKGDREYNNPAYNTKGVLFTSNYYDGTKLSFRRHNTKKENSHRFALKPRYTKGKNETLPRIPIIYLGLFRLLSFGEYEDDSNLKKINKKIPNNYVKEIEKLYKDFTQTSIIFNNSNDMGGIKNRVEFSTEVGGIDSNTVSSGEDNLLIILTALISLKYYFENIESTKKIESILLIDEIDATLHPAFQIKIFDLLKDFSSKYKIQIFFTTHSLSLLEYGLKEKTNLIYLIKSGNGVAKMEGANKYSIEAHLKNQLVTDIYQNRFIPIYTEDDEARLFLETLFEYYSSEFKGFALIDKRFHFVKANLSSEALRSIFSDDKILKSIWVQYVY